MTYVINFMRLFWMCIRKGWTVKNAIGTAWKVSQSK